MQTIAKCCKHLQKNVIFCKKSKKLRKKIKYVGNAKKYKTIIVRSNFNSRELNAREMHRYFGHSSDTRKR